MRHAYNITKKNMKLFGRLRQIREFERVQMPFLKSIVDFDIVIEVGYAQEEEHPLTLKQLLLLRLSSRTTVRRRLARLIAQGVVRRRKNAKDHRSSLLSVTPGSLKLFDRYHGALTAVFTVGKP